MLYISYNKHGINGTVCSQIHIKAVESFQVTVGKSQKYVNTGCDSSSPSPPSHSKDHTYKSKFEVPPRLQKVTPILGRSTSMEHPNPPTLRRSASMEQPNSPAGSPGDLHKVF